MHCFASDSRKISWVARHFSPGSPALDWWVSQLQENARAHSFDHPNAPRFAGTYSVAGVPFPITVLVDISLFLRTLAKIFSDPYASQTALHDFQSLTMGKLSVVQLTLVLRRWRSEWRLPRPYLWIIIRKHCLLPCTDVLYLVRIGPLVPPCKSLWTLLYLLLIKRRRFPFRIDLNLHRCRCLSLASRSLTRPWLWTSVLLPLNPRFLLLDPRLNFLLNFIVNSVSLGGLVGVFKNLTMIFIVQTRLQENRFVQILKSLRPIWIHTVWLTLPLLLRPLLV